MPRGACHTPSPTSGMRAPVPSGALEVVTSLPIMGSPPTGLLSLVRPRVHARRRRSSFGPRAHRVSTVRLRMKHRAIGAADQLAERHLALVVFVAPPRERGGDADAHRHASAGRGVTVRRSL